MQTYFDNMQLLATNESQPFAESVYVELQKIVADMSVNLQPMGSIRFEVFPNKEIFPHIETNVRKSIVYVFHHFCDYDGINFDPNVGFMKLYNTDDALRNSSPAEINYVVPFIPYLRQDRVSKRRAPISARRVLDMVRDPESNITTRLITFDMHSGQVQGFVHYMIDHLYAERLLYDGIDSKTVIVAPDTGATKRAQRIAEKFDLDYAIIDKKRKGPGDTSPMKIVGDVEGKKAIIFDDIIDTADTMLKGAHALKEHGAAEVELRGIHGIFSPKDDKAAEDKIRDIGLRVTTTDTLPRQQSYLDKNSDWLTIKTTAPMIARALYEIQRPHGSISKLFEDQ